MNRIITITMISICILYISIMHILIIILFMHEYHEQDY